MAVIIMLLLICFVFLVVQVIFSENYLNNDLQLSSLESGFESLNHIAFISSSFFMLAVLFVMFDVELIILFPGLLFFNMMDFSKNLMWLLVIFMVLITLVVEWKVFGLKWYA